jgi:signal transduction histidine kinase
LQGKREAVMRWASMLGLAAAIFVGDTVTDFEIAVAVLYVVVVLIANGFLPTRGVLVISFGCIALTLASFMLSRAGAFGPGLVNCALSVSAIAATTYLALKSAEATLAEQAARAQLIRLARVNSLSETTASIAHEVNQPITGIIVSGNACLNWLACDPPNLPKARQAVQRMISDAERTSGIVARIRNLYKLPKLNAKWIDARSVVDQVLALSETELKRNNVAVTVIFAGAALEIYAEAVQIELVLLNIMLNAIESVTRGCSEPRVAIEVRLEDEKHVEFLVSDSGHGVAPDRLETIFEAFYTTKADGTGIGLAISRSIIDAHGGRVWAAADAEGGAEFHFVLLGRKKVGA